MILERAQRVAELVIKKLSPYCERIEVAGSVRRKRPQVHDVDFVLIPSDPWNLHHEIGGMGMAKAKGEKLCRVMIGDVQVDLYFADESTWATLLLVKTGPKESNIRLATLAKDKGWHLAAGGAGLFDENGQRIAGDTEESIFEALGLPYQIPEKRI